MLKSLLIGVSTALMIVPAAQAQIVVQGSGLAQDCFQKTKLGDPGRKSTIRMCEKALENKELNRKNEAATYINTAILYMRGGNYDKAEARYISAIKIDASLSEAYISLAANHIFKGEYQSAVNAVGKGIDLGTERMPEALYNRAMAYDHLEQYSLAYKDLKHALTYRPDWDIALRALENYEVVSKPKASG